MIRIINRSMSLRGGGTHGGGSGGGRDGGGVKSGAGPGTHTHALAHAGGGGGAGQGAGGQQGDGKGDGGGAGAGVGAESPGSSTGQGEGSAHGPTPLVLGSAAESRRKPPGFVSGPTLQKSRVLGLVENGDLPASSVPHGQNRYLNRPLPVPPPRVKLSIMPPLPRPSTSTGRPPGRPAVHKLDARLDKLDKFDRRRISRDDMFLNSSSFSSRMAGLGLDRDSRRISRDDMFLGARQQQQQQASLTTWRPSGFHIPMRASPSPNPPSPRAASPTFTPPFAIPRRRDTPESLRSAEIPIGMALGSPTHMPPSINSSRAPSALATSWVPHVQKPPEPPQALEPPPVQQLVSEQQQPTELKRTKTGRRKLFGLFGSRKNSESAKPATVVATHSSHALEAASEPAYYPGAPHQGSIASSASVMSRSHTTAGINSSKHKPLLVRTATEPHAISPIQESPQPSPLRMQQQPLRGINVSGPVGLGRGSGPLPNSSRPGLFLDVEIPDIKMERYSVMFGSLLKPHSQNQQQQASSLLARRQATLDRLRTINDKIVQEEEAKEKATLYRRATSPQPAAAAGKSPAFTIFPPTPSSRPEPGSSVTSSPPKRSTPPRNRSNTSPARLPSPSRATFAKDQTRRDPTPSGGSTAGRPNFLNVSSALAPVAAAASRQSPANVRERPLANAQVERVVVHFEPDQSSLILDSPSSIDSVEYASATITRVTPPSPQVQIPAPPLRPHVVAEPQWQMISPPGSAAPSTGSSSSMSSGRRRSPSSASSVQTHVTKPSVEIEEPDTALKAAVEISIARQISISRQQRRLLRPLQTTNITTAGSAPVSAPGSRGGRSPLATSPLPNSAGAGMSTATKTSPVRLGKNQTLQETKLALPTLIHPRQTPTSQFLSHRKSERAVLEAA